jgi:metal-responsive CopG/Arc/MetJ family transcriptional regulator
MAKTRITITLDPEIEAWVTVAAKAIGKSQSEIVRICLREYFAQNPNRFSMSDKARSDSEDAWRRG